MPLIDVMPLVQATAKFIGGTDVAKPIGFRNPPRKAQKAQNSSLGELVEGFLANIRPKMVIRSLRQTCWFWRLPMAPTTADTAVRIFRIYMRWVQEQRWDGWSPTTILEHFDPDVFEVSFEKYGGRKENGEGALIELFQPSFTRRQHVAGGGYNGCSCIDRIYTSPPPR